MGRVLLADDLPIDADGVIRNNDLRPEDLDKAVEALVTEAEAAARNPVEK